MNISVKIATYPCRRYRNISNETTKHIGYTQYYFPLVVQSHFSLSIAYQKLGIWKSYLNQEGNFTQMI